MNTENYSKVIVYIANMATGGEPTTINVGDEQRRFGARGGIKHITMGMSSCWAWNIARKFPEIKADGPYVAISFQ